MADRDEPIDGSDPPSRLERQAEALAAQKLAEAEEELEDLTAVGRPIPPRRT